MADNNVERDAYIDRLRRTIDYLTDKMNASNNQNEKAEYKSKIDLCRKTIEEYNANPDKEPLIKTMINAPAIADRGSMNFNSNPVVANGPSTIVLG